MQMDMAGVTRVQPTSSAMVFVTAHLDGSNPALAFVPLARILTSLTAFHAMET